jgi:hypothetical protein
MYFINNYTILHARTAFDDFEEEDRRRHLLRLWLEVPQMRPVHPHIRSGGIEAVPALIRLERTDQEPQLTGAVKGQAMIANPIRTLRSISAS